jgi:hypothetical protein
MRARLSIVVGLVALVSAPAVRGQITDNPIPARLEKRGLAVEIRDVVRLRYPRPPPARSGRVARRLGALTTSATSRRAAVRQDSRGQLYRIGANNQLSTYADVAAAF